MDEARDASARLVLRSEVDTSYQDHEEESEEEKKQGRGLRTGPGNPQAAWVWRVK